MCGSMYMNVGILEGHKRMSVFPGSGSGSGSGGCEPPEAGAGNRTCVLCKNCMCSSLLYSPQRKLLGVQKLFLSPSTLLRKPLCCSCHAGQSPVSTSLLGVTYAHHCIQCLLSVGSGDWTQVVQLAHFSPLSHLASLSFPLVTDPWHLSLTRPRPFSAHSRQDLSFPLQKPPPLCAAITGTNAWFMGCSWPGSGRRGERIRRPREALWFREHSFIDAHLCCLEVH